VFSVGKLAGITYPPDQLRYRMMRTINRGKCDIGQLNFLIASLIMEAETIWLTRNRLMLRFQSCHREISLAEFSAAIHTTTLHHFVQNRKRQKIKNFHVEFLFGRCQIKTRQKKMGFLSFVELRRFCDLPGITFNSSDGLKVIGQLFNQIEVLL